jgi:hypothetical protein
MTENLVFPDFTRNYQERFFVREVGIKPKAGCFDSAREQIRDHEMLYLYHPYFIVLPAADQVYSKVWSPDDLATLLELHKGKKGEFKLVALSHKPITIDVILPKAVETVTT